MEYPQITQITQISARTSGRAKRPQKPWLYHKRSLAFLGARKPALHHPTGPPCRQTMSLLRRWQSTLSRNLRNLCNLRILNSGL
jgi:hypothetical protein